ncbi:alpha-amylase family glycosyl hydrolase [Psychroserpens sp. NJDZ02]|uniref:alpha-amylase family glycosyl hydrolase n=1 Tax=Psychroserpens sp. NJDZ02 TaxID=2570561 RepID=UPI0010A7845F|nr:alpha-amylase family glycosyl hydrolase [Psychroserpens sp. NJDZ02]QCE41547.1 T9SS type A sorting domain-containing protein [Psychroserpens sp. NJDZ02]
MKKHYFLIALLFSLFAKAQVNISPFPFNVDQSITITVDVNSTATNCNGLNTPNTVYFHSGIGDDTNAFGYNAVGNWGQDDGVGAMTDNNNGTWSITIVPETYYSLTSAQANSATKLGIVFRNEDGSQELKDNGCSDFIYNVGSFQVNLTTPSENSVTQLNNGSDLSIAATNTNGNANYSLSANGSVLNSLNAITNYAFTHTNITENQYYTLTVTQGLETVVKEFSVLISATPITEALPNGMDNGINYNTSDNTKATLVLEAPNKDYIYVAGSFNNYQPTNADLMKKDPTSGIFWLELTNLTPNQIETYQYWVNDANPITNSPQLVKTADPYSTLVLSPFDDAYIPTTTYPNLPTYPVGQEREVTVLQTGQIAYPWVVTDFNKPKKEDLVIYEVLIRDFDADRNFQDLIDKIAYFKNLNVNAIQLMPIMEFEGNESWGYNTSFHLALDKFYGTETKLKEFIDLCHQNDIAVILDVALNHAFGRNPMNRMWMTDADGDGWGEPSTENPYFNTTARHSYSVGSDFNHQSLLTQHYVERVVKHWVEEFKIDGLRWDLTKGFTQNAQGSDSQTNAYQADRVAILKDYADYSWSLDPTHYVIFEHLGFGGSAQEETEWANYRLADSEPKGIMLWGKLTNPYNQLTMGYNSDNNFNDMGHVSRGFDAPRLVGYAESHDEERLMYKNLQYGNASNPSHDVTDLNTAISRMSALGAVSLTIPGPKMIWHFAELGMENSIFTCNNGTVNDTNGTDGDCKLDTKPQPQWADNWEADAIRSQVYSDWSRLNELKINEPVFEGDYTITSGSLTPRIDIFDTSIASSELGHVIVLANFDVVSQTVNTSFPTSGTWYDLMDATGSTTIQSTVTTITIPAGEFRIYGNAVPQTLSTEDFQLSDSFKLYPNPSKTTFSVTISARKVQVIAVSGKVIKSYTGTFEAGHKFNVENLAKGLYLVKTENNKGQIKTTKLIKS